jgi:hypothetical protein
MWLYNNVEFTPEMIQDNTGFVYIITHLQTGRQYVGQKNLWMPKIKSVKGKKKRIKVHSDYLDYWGSNEELKEDVRRLGADNFKREILYLCKNKGTQNYLELREQIDRRVMESDAYYNSFVGGKIHKKHIKL